MNHDLKLSQKYFKDVGRGIKTFEIRKNDRNYQVGDTIFFHEVEEETGEYTGWGSKKFKITYITDYAQQDGYVVMAIK